MINEAQKKEGMVLVREACDGNCFCTCDDDKKKTVHEYLDKYPPFKPSKE